MILPLYFLAAFGLAYVVGFAVITRTPREVLAIYALGTDGGKSYPFAAWLLSMIECPMCFSWWVGLAFGAGVYFGQPAWWPLNPVATLALLPFATTGVSLVLGTYVGIVDLKPKENAPPPETT